MTDNIFLLQYLTLFFPLVLLGLLFLFRYGILNPITYILVLFLYGTTFKVLYLNQFDELHILESKLLVGSAADILMDGLLVLVVSILILVAVFSAAHREKNNEFDRSFVFQKKALSFHFVVAALLIVSIFGFAMFLYTSEASFSLDNLIAKRFSDDGGRGSERVFQSGYIYYRIALLAKIAFVLVFINFLHEAERSKLLWFYLIVSFILSFVTPIYFSNRFGALLVVVDMIIIYVVIRGRLNAKLVLSSVVLLVVLLAVISVMRYNGSESNKVLEHLVTGRYMFDLYKISSIINHYVDPAVFNLLGSSSQEGAMASGLMNIGDVIASDVYSEPHNSIPPGVIPEVFVKYGWLGIVVVMASVGLLVSLVDNYSKVTHNIALKVILQMLVFRIVFLLSNNDMTTMLLKPIGDLFPLLILSVFVFSYGKRNIRDTGHGTEKNELS